MKYILLLIIFCSINTFAQDTTKVLFIGNSITYFNDMPQTFEAIANSKLDTTSVTVYAPGGTGFINHVNDVNVYNHFKTGGWDFVVLQPGSNESPGYSEPIENTLERARQLKDSILFYNPCAKIIYYEISYGVWGATPDNLIQYNETMDLIKANLTQLADSTELCFAPAGEAIKTAWNDNQNIMLWNGTGDIHPNAKGSYIIACSFYASIFQKPSLGSNITGGLTPQEAEVYQVLADTTVLNYKQNWRIGTFDLVADFNFTTNGINIANFYDDSQNADSLVWDFGDGSFSTIVNPIHTFNILGNHIVTLTAYKNGCAKSQSHSIIIELLATNYLNEDNEMKIYPNPTNGKVILELPYLEDEEVTVSIFDNNGMFLNMIIISNKTKILDIDLSNYATGYYTLIIGTNKYQTIKRVLKL